MAFAGGATPWPYPQITPFDGAALAPLLVQGAAVWQVESYRALAGRLR